MKNTSRHETPTSQKKLPTGKADPDLWNEHYHKIADRLEEWGLCGELKGYSVPLEVWAGLVQPIADLSGYRIVLQAANSEDNLALDKTPLYVDVAVATPSMFVNVAKTSVLHSAATVMKESKTPVPRGHDVF